MPEDKTRSAFAGNRSQFVMIAGAAFALAVILFLLWYLMLRTTLAPAFSDLKPADASLIVDELKRQKTPYELADDGKTIRVPADQVDAARVAILGGDLPLKGTVGFELFSKSDMGLTEFAQKINYQRALQGELARTLMSMSTIESARIHITLPESGIFQDDHRAAKASVTITPKLGETIEGPAIVGIQRLVASAVDDLDAANVVVLDGTGRQLSAETPVAEAAPAGGGSELERAYADQVRGIALQLVNDKAMRVTVWAPPGAAIEPRKPEAPAGTAPASARQARRFPLRVTIALSGEPAADLRDRLVLLLRSSIGYDPAAGDSLMLITLPAAASYQVGAPTASATGVKPEESWSGDRSAWPSSAWIAFAAIVALSGIGIALGIRRRSRMRPEARQRFAERLRELLDEDERLRDGRA